MASRKKETYQTEPRTYVLFRLCWHWTIKDIFSDYRNVLGWNLSAHLTKMAAKNISTGVLRVTWPILNLTPAIISPEQLKWVAKFCMQVEYIKC